MNKYSAISKLTQELSNKSSYDIELAELVFKNKIPYKSINPVSGMRIVGLPHIHKYTTSLCFDGLLFSPRYPAELWITKEIDNFTYNIKSLDDLLPNRYSRMLISNIDKIAEVKFYDQFFSYSIDLLTAFEYYNTYGIREENL